MKSLNSQHSKLANPGEQFEILEHSLKYSNILVPFQQKLIEDGIYPLSPTTISNFQINIGKMCNQVCKHCHVDAGPDRKEIMSKETMNICLQVLEKNPQFEIVDITGGAPEMNPNFRWFVEEIKKMNRHIIVRCNLTIITSNKKYADLPQFYKENNIEVISSLPYYKQDRTDRQRGQGVFQDSIKALQLLNKVGYGENNSNLVLNLVYNPAGAFLPSSQDVLEKEYKIELKEQFGISFNNLFTITNLPISRFLDYLLQTDNYENYMEILVASYNTKAANNVMCRNTISVGWDGYIYDCDFNQMLELKVAIPQNHISVFNFNQLKEREIIIGQHCYGCTAGAGSSCGGSLI